MTNHEDYSGYKPQQPLGRSGGLSVETHISDHSRTEVVSPIIAMKENLPTAFKPVRPHRTIHPYFLNGQDPNALSPDAPSYDAESPEGKAIAELSRNIDAAEFSSQEINNLAAVMDAAPGELQGWTNLTDVWD